MSNLVTELISDIASRICGPQVPFSKIVMIDAGTQARSGDEGSVFSHLFAIKRNDGSWAVAIREVTDAQKLAGAKGSTKGKDGLTAEEAYSLLSNIAREMEPGHNNALHVRFTDAVDKLNEGIVSLKTAKKWHDNGIKFGDPTPQDRNRNTQPTGVPSHTRDCGQ